MQLGCSTATTRPRNRPGMASLLASALEETCAVSARVPVAVAPNAAPIAFRQFRRVQRMMILLRGYWFLQYHKGRREKIGDNPIPNAALRGGVHERRAALVDSLRAQPLEPE